MKIFSVIDKERGFSLVEVLIAMAILSIGLLAMASTSTSVITGNSTSDKVTQATVQAQDLLEDLRNKTFFLGPDGVLGNDGAGNTDDYGPDAAWGNATTPGDDYLAAELRDPDCNPDANNVCATQDISTAINIGSPVLFTASDKWDGSNLAVPTARPTLGRNPQRVWNITDNVPVAGTKTVTVIVGWQEGSTNKFVTMSTIIAGTRFANMPGAK